MDSDMVKYQICRMAASIPPSIALYAVTAAPFCHVLLEFHVLV
jgi:hypothetical protein